MMRSRTRLEPGLLYESIRLLVVARLWYLQASNIEGDNIIENRLNPLALSRLSGGAEIGSGLSK
jgi:hypothetical protein